MGKNGRELMNVNEWWINSEPFAMEKEVFSESPKEHLTY
ncbi:hypothetical protein BSG1_03860 [Bacillus sp. SG-1]|nr:hypothetical protein BSG1_03860 [Bacillus sp. SG-1]